MSALKDKDEKVDTDGDPASSPTFEWGFVDNAVKYKVVISLDHL